MTYGDSGDNRLGKNERREVARQKAQAHREVQKKKDRRSRFLLQGGLIVVVLTIIAVVSLVIANTYLKPPSPGPLNMASDGIKIGQKFEAVSTGALQPGSSPVAVASNAPGVIDIRIYLDYQCPICGVFEKTNADQIKTWVKSGAATVEIHPISFLDRASLGTKYSTRAANAAACVANFSPNSFFDFSTLLFTDQPAENTEGLTDDRLISLAKKANVTSVDSVATCISDQSFKSWVNAATARAAAGPIPNSNVDKLIGVPTIIVNGAKYTGAIDDSNAFAQFVSTAAGNAFAAQSTATPTPTPSP
ncbi:MAG: DsbA family protein [Lacisediminihabitans sp.]